MNAIEVRGLSKVYRLYRKPIDRLKEAVLRRPFHQPFESLRDVSFTVPFGAGLGVIGENGAGKSTLLKILAGTLTPTAGEVIRRGRAAALLELGAGFHAEFTGRQNIYLNAALLGLTDAEIREREEDIVEFAELGPFIERPLNTYSSGMKIRLAFSVATSVDPDILIIDEALSVGDQYFQKKCIDRMIGFRERGKTILFCSHAMFTVNQLCERCIWLHHGSVRAQGSATSVTAEYENFARERGAKEVQKMERGKRPHEKPPVAIRSIMLNGDPGPIQMRYREDLSVLIEYESIDSRPFWIAMGIRRNDELVCHGVNMARDLKDPLQKKGIGRIMINYPSLPFLHGEFYVVGIALDESGLQPYHIKESSPFTIIPPEAWRNEVGLLDLEHEWVIPQEQRSA
jgi:ABC-type polysaccharide/polyol phosphate transport system ATPase subunit